MFFCMGISVVVAQEIQAENLSDKCLEYYPVDSLRVSAKPSLEYSSYVFKAGESIKYELSMENRSKVLIPDAGIVLRIEKLKNAKAEVDEKIIEEIILDEKISLNPGESRDIIKEIKLPKKIESGSYAIVALPIRGRNMNVGTAGFNFFEFSADANKSEQFRVESELSESLGIIKDSIKINGNSYDEKARFEIGSDDILITQALKNYFKTETDVSIKSELFKMNYYAESNKIDSSSQSIVVPAGGSVEIKIDTRKIRENTNVPHYLRTEIDSDKGKIISILSINEASFSHFAFLDTKTTEKDGKAKMFLCINRRGLAPGIKIESILLDNKGNEIAKIDKSDNIEKEEFITFEEINFEIKKDYPTLILKSKIYSENKMIDEYEVYFEDIKSSIKEKITESTKTKGEIVKIILISSTIIILVIVSVFWIIRKKKKNDMIGSVLFLIFAVVLFFGGKNFVSAATIFDFYINQTATAASSSDRFLQFNNFDISNSLRLRTTKDFIPSYPANKITFSSGVVTDGDKIDFGFINRAKTGDELSLEDTYQLNSIDATIKSSTNGMNVRAIGPAWGTSSLNIAKANTPYFFAGMAYNKPRDGATPFSSEGTGPNPNTYWGLGMMAIFTRGSYFGTPFEELTVPSYKIAIPDGGDSNFCQYPKGKLVGMESSISPVPSYASHILGRGLRYNPTDQERFPASAGYDSNDAMNSCSNGRNNCDQYGSCNNPGTVAAVDNCMEDQCYNQGGKWFAFATGSWEKRCRNPWHLWNSMECDDMRRSEDYYAPFLELINDYRIKGSNGQKPTSITEKTDPNNIIYCVNNSCTLSGNSGIATIEVKVPKKPYIAAYLFMKRTSMTGDGDNIGMPSAGNVGINTIKSYGEFIEGIKIITIEVQGPVNGVCGNRATNISVNPTYYKYAPAYPATTYSNWPADANSFCLFGSPAPITPATILPNFPGQGKTVEWNCNSLNGGANAYCSARRLAPTQARCGTADGINYKYSDTNFGGYSYCAIGNPNPNPPIFPDPGATSNWKCEKDGIEDYCKACRKIDSCSNEIREEYCKGQFIPSGCGSTDCQGLRHCDDSGDPLLYDARCCNGGWIEVKP